MAANGRTLVSVIIPVYGPAPYLEAALTSVSRQTHRAVECVVVDDRAAPGLAERVDRALPRARVVACHGAGLAAARNTGIAETGGELVAFIDSDDLWTASKLERQVAALAASEGCGVALCAFHDLHGQRVGALRPRHTTFREGCALEAVMLDDLAIPSAALCARAALEDVGGFDEGCQYFEDYSLFTRLAVRTGFVFLPWPLVLYRRHATQMTSVKESGVLEIRSQITGRALAALPTAEAERLRPRALAHDRWVAGHWHRGQGRRVAALRCAVWGLRAFPRCRECLTLAAMCLAPAALERAVRRRLARPAQIDDEVREALSGAVEALVPEGSAP